MSLFPKKGKNAEVSTQNEMGFFDHLEELRWHIVRSLMAIITFGAVFFIAKSFTFDTIIFGPKKPEFITYRIICSISEAICFRPPQLDLITRELGEQFFTHIKVSFWMGIIIAFPYIFWEFWKFVSPGLYEREKKAARGIVFVCSMLFGAGVMFGYFIIAPFAVTWLGSYSVGSEAINAPTLASYVNYLTMFTIPTGVMFELPLLAYFLGKIGVLTSTYMAQFRRHAIVLIFLVAAILTPPDVITQIIISIPIIFLYELSIHVLRKIEKNKKQL
jgi:sec-independent protein translocase protein TatC